MRGYCPHFREVMDLEDCYFCFFKRVVNQKSVSSEESNGERLDAMKGYTNSSIVDSDVGSNPTPRKTVPAKQTVDQDELQLKDESDKEWVEAWEKRVPNKEREK